MVLWFTYNFFKFTTSNHYKVMPWSLSFKLSKRISLNILWTIAIISKKFPWEMERSWWSHLQFQKRRYYSFEEKELLTFVYSFLLKLWNLLMFSNYKCITKFAIWIFSERNFSWWNFIHFSWFCGMFHIFNLDWQVLKVFKNIENFINWFLNNVFCYLFCFTK